MIRFVMIGILVVCSFVSASTVQASGEAPGVSADVALNQLKDGNARFIVGKPDHPRQNFDRRNETTQKGQKPFASVLACSDSRVPVEVIFDQGIGDIFVVRVAGNVANVDETGSIEYGTDHLGTPLLVVLGHTRCGAVTAVVQNDEVHGNIPALVKGIVPAVEQAKKSKPGLKGEELIDAAINANVWQAIEDIFKSSPTVAGRVKDGKLMVLGALYHIDTGKVSWMGSHPKQDQLLSAAKSQPKH
ncbi:MAG TPA: carbonic anhydrase [Desulfomonilaceae bacterium]|nr:carbonic anhydrase [Desulfomonilaceae bacterium]